MEIIVTPSESEDRTAVCAPRAGTPSVSPDSTLELERFRFVLDASDDALITKTLDGIITTWNRGAERMFGYAAGEAIGQSILMLFPPERRHEEAQIIARLRAGEQIDHVETERLHKSGRRIHVLVTVSPMRTSTGQIIGAAKIVRDITVSKEAEAQMNFARTLVDSSDDAIASKTLDGIITSWNAGAERVFGYTAEEAIGQPMVMLFPGHKAHEEAQILRRIRDGERIRHFETQRVRKDGRLIDVSVTISPIRDEAGRIVGASKIARDITERKQADAQKALAALLIESSDDAIVSKTLDGIITSWNAGAERVFGYTAEEAIGQPMLMLFPQYKIAEEDEILRNIRNGERIDHFETLRVRKDRRLIHISATISPMRDEAGRIVGASKIARDITERKQADQQKALSALLIESSDDAIISKTLDGIITSWNMGAQRLFGYTAEEAIGQPMLMLFPQDKQKEEDYILSQIRAGNRVDHFETLRVRRDRTPIHVSVTISPMRDENGRIIGASKIARDITQLREQREALKRMAHFDALTGLPNRTLLHDRLEQGIARCDRDNTALAVLYMDLDGFKAVNDTHGHDAGDEVLRTISRRVQGILRRTDTLARLGGDEFVAVMPGLADLDQCTHLIERIIEECATPVDYKGIELQVSASIGLTTYPQDQVDGDRLIRHADIAMYEAKHSGKNCYAIYDAMTSTHLG